MAQIPWYHYVLGIQLADVSPSLCPFIVTQLHLMSYAIEAKDAVYFFVTDESNCVKVTKLVRKGCKGYDQSTKVSKELARRWYHKLCNA